jgi:hypothetical protein
VDGRGRVVGEAKGYDPYSGFGEIMLYEIDSFGYVSGYVSKGIRLMSEEAQYDCWKRHNIVDLIAEDDRMFKDRDYFERFCKTVYRDVLEKEKQKQ